MISQIYSELFCIIPRDKSRSVELLHHVRAIRYERTFRPFSMQNATPPVICWYASSHRRLVSNHTKPFSSEYRASYHETFLGQLRLRLRDDRSRCSCNNYASICKENNQMSTGSGWYPRYCGIPFFTWPPLVELTS